MFVGYIFKHKNMILTSVFFFYFGCAITLNFSSMECVTTADNHSQRSFSNNFPDSDTVEYVVLVLSSPSNEDKRNSVRSSWARLSSNIVVETGEKLYRWNQSTEYSVTKSNFLRIYFVVGVKNISSESLSNLVEENQKHNDILLLDGFIDTYQNLTTKLLYSIVKFYKEFTNLKYLVKCDDDSFVRIDLIIKELEAFAPEMSALELKPYVSYKLQLPKYKGLYWGYFNGAASVFKRGKYEEKDWFLCDKYLPYTLGGAYVISKSIVDFIGRNHDDLSCYKSEDVSMGVWTAPLDGINRVHDIRFDTEYLSRGCRNDMLVRHNLLPEDLNLMYKSLITTNGKKQCKKEYETKIPYSYNWALMPSKCCK